MFLLFWRLPEIKILYANVPYMSSNQKKWEMSVWRWFWNSVCFIEQIGNSKKQKKYLRNERHLCLVVYIFIKLSQNVCLIKIPNVTSGCEKFSGIIAFLEIICFITWNVITLSNFYKSDEFLTFVWLVLLYDLFGSRSRISINSYCIR